MSLTPHGFTTQVGGLNPQKIPAGHALRSCLALKRWSIERKSHVMPLVTDEGLGLLAGWHRQVAGDQLFDASSFNLDFHSVPFFGDDPIIENHYLSMRSRSQPSVLTFLAPDAEGRAFCYSNANLRKGEAADEVLRFVEFWERNLGKPPRHLVFDLDVPTRKYQSPRVFEQNIVLAGHHLRQLFIMDLGHEEPTILISNDRKAPLVALITRYAQRMRGYSDAQARVIFRDLIDIPADVEITEKEVMGRMPVEN